MQTEVQREKKFEKMSKASINNGMISRFNIRELKSQKEMRKK